jgi:hypothetical protein
MTLQAIEGGLNEHGEPKRLPGRVTRVTLRMLASGRVAHNTRVEFVQEPVSHPYISTVVTGHMPASWGEQDWHALMLEALSQWYEIIDNALPPIRWTRDSKTRWPDPPRGGDEHGRVQTTA